MKLLMNFPLFLICFIISSNLFAQALGGCENGDFTSGLGSLNESAANDNEPHIEVNSIPKVRHINQKQINLLFTEDWSSGSFSTNNWTFEPSAGNWFIAFSTVLGNPAPAAVFSWNPILTNYSYSMISSEIDVSEITGQIMFDFDYFYDEWTPTQTEFLKVYAQNADDWILIDSFVNYGDVQWTTKSYNLDDFANGAAIRIKFEASGQNSNNIDRWIIDNIKIYESNPDLYPKIELSTYSILAMPMDWNDIRTEYFTIYNTGQADLIWESNIEYLKGDELSKHTIDSDFNINLNSLNASDSKTVWLTLSPSSGSIASGASQIIAAVFNPGDVLNEYWHQANILLSSNDPLNPVVTVSAEMYIGWTNLSEQTMEQIMVGPIPSNGSLHIKLIDDITAIQMLSLTGQQIFLTNVFGMPHVKMDLNDYKSGTYVLKFIHKSGDIALRKIVLF